MNIKVRTEVVRCLKCKHKNEFMYISDFSYGERLVLYNNGTKYAYINLLEDNVYNDFFETIKNIYIKQNKLLLEDELISIVNKIFNVTCDKIEGSTVDFFGARRCDNCGSDVFENILIEPETIIITEVPQITHKEWNTLSDDKRLLLIINKLENETYK